MKQNDDNPWQTLSSKIVYQNPWMKVREDKVITPGGTDGIYGVVEAKSGVFIIALTDDEKIHLIESYRYPMQRWQWELPTGGIEAGMKPLTIAQHELAEELGVTADSWEQIGVFGPSYNGYLNDEEYVFVAKGLHFGEAHHEAGEAIRATKTVSLSEVMQMIKDDQLPDGQTLAALMQFVVWREKR